MTEKEENIHFTLWIAHSLFDRGKTSGTTANISFRMRDTVCISRSGSCFGTLKAEDLVEIGMDGVAAGPDTGYRPSKEAPLHLMLYAAHPEISAVIHTHAPNAVLWSCLMSEESRDVIPHHTPYLQMKLGNVAAVPYADPGSDKLFRLFKDHLGPERGYLLSHHGPVVGGLNLMNAFEAIEELEQECWLARQLNHN